MRHRAVHVSRTRRCRSNGAWIGWTGKTYDYFLYVASTLPLSVYEGTWTHSPCSLLCITMILHVRRIFFEYYVPQHMRQRRSSLPYPWSISICPILVSPEQLVSSLLASRRHHPPFSFHCTMQQTTRHQHPRSLSLLPLMQQDTIILFGTTIFESMECL